MALPGMRSECNTNANTMTGVQVKGKRKMVFRGWKIDNGIRGENFSHNRLLSFLRPPSSPFFQDRRGTSLVTYSLVLPMFLMLIFGAATVWQVISVKQSMDAATYEAARYLSREGRRIAARALPYYDADAWARTAHEEIDEWLREQIRRNPFVDQSDDIQIEIVPPVDVECNPWGAYIMNTSRAPENIRFTVTTRLVFNSSIQIPFVGSPLNFTLQESHSELVECPRFRSRPPDEGPIFFPRSGR